MQLQISSGQGPVECELAVAKLAAALCEEFDGTTIKQTSLGIRDGCFRSVILESEHDLSFLEGSVKWICQSPFRPNHKRKNWFIDVSPIQSQQQETAELDDKLIRFDTFRSGGKGGQHVNKVETGVRATYIPLGISVTCTEARSQHMNKKLAMQRLCALVSERELGGSRAIDHMNWLEHSRLVRGGAARVYEGPEFRQVK
jgi:peptide chain release factor